MEDAQNKVLALLNAGDVSSEQGATFDVDSADQDTDCALINALDDYDCVAKDSDKVTVTAPADISSKEAQDTVTALLNAGDVSNEQEAQEVPVKPEDLESSAALSLRQP